MSFKIMIQAGAAALALSALGACSIWAVGENAPSARAERAQAPAPAQTAQQQPAPPITMPGVAAPGVEAPAAPPPPPEREDPNTVVVRGQTERQVTSPDADPRSVSERMADVRAWDRCVTRAQAGSEDPTRVQMDTPEEICSRSLGMSGRNAVPNSRRP